MSAGHNTAIAERFYEILNSGRLDSFDEILSDGFIDHNPVPGQKPGIAGLKEVLAGFRGSFPDITFTIEDIIAGGDKVVVRTIGRGTHRGEFMGISPSGKKVEFSAIDIHRIVKNRIAESWHIEELLSVMAQIGASGVA